MTCARNIPLALLITVLVTASPASACTPPERPFLPTSREDMRAYADLIRGISRPISPTCRITSAASIEAREVSEEYGRFIQALE